MGTTGTGCDRDEAPLPVARAPLLWILVPLAAGIAICRAVPAFNGAYPAACALALALGALLLSSAKGRLRRAAWALCVVGCVFSLGLAWGAARLLDRQEDRAFMPVREVVIEMSVKRVFPCDAWGRSRGIARVVAAPPVQEHLRGQHVAYSVKDAPELSVGAVYRVKGLTGRKPVNPQEASFDAWLAQNEVYYELKRGRLLEKVADAPQWMQRLGSLREKLAVALVSGSDRLPEIRAMFPAMFLGKRNLLAPEDKDLFRSTGMMHLFAVSGLHVGLVALTLEGLLALLRIGRRRRIGLGLVVLLAYVMLIGAPASAVRAFIMLFFHRAGQVWGRPTRGLPALAASAVAVLVWNPQQLFDVGARLSYGIVAGILLYGIPLGERMPLYKYLPPGSQGRRHRAVIAARDWLCGGLGVGLGAFLIGAPLSIQYFGVFAPGSMLLNLLLVPVALLCVSAATLSGGLFTVGLVLHMDWPGAIGRFVNHAGWFCTWLMHGVMDGSVHVPLLFWKCGFPTSWTGSFTALILLGMSVMLRSPPLARRLAWQLVPPATLLAVVLAALAAG